MGFEMQIFEVSTTAGGTGTYTVLAGDKWKVLKTIAEEVTFDEAMNAAKKALDQVKVA
jgi:hypothetical protein